MAELHLLSPRGFRASGVYAGIKSKQTPDVGLLVCDGTATAAAVFTTNKVFAPGEGRPRARRRRQAPRRRRQRRQRQRLHRQAGRARRPPDVRPRRRSRSAATRTRSSPPPPASSATCCRWTKSKRGIADAGQYSGDREHALLFADAILTTDLKRKAAAASSSRPRDGHARRRLQGQRDDRPAHGGAPRDDARLPHHRRRDHARAAPQAARLRRRRQLQRRHGRRPHQHQRHRRPPRLSGARREDRLAHGAEAFAAALDEVCQSLAYQIAADGEGATKVVVITVNGARPKPTPTPWPGRSPTRRWSNAPCTATTRTGAGSSPPPVLAGVPFDPDRGTLTLQGTRRLPRRPAGAVRRREGERIAEDVRKSGSNLSCRLAKPRRRAGRAICRRNT